MARRSKRLKRSLSLPLVTLYGLGNILGAGIYVLVGKVAGSAGSSAALAFLIAMAIAALTALSYMELASRYPVSASVSVYLHKAFGRRWLSILIGLAMVASGVASAAALAQGFAGYLDSIIGVPTLVASVGLLIFIGLLAAKGIGESAIFAAVLTCLEVLGLVIIIWVGRSAFASADVGTVLHIDPSVGWAGVMAGAFLAFYAFIGFEDMVNVSEEVKNPRRTMPLAILISLIVATVLYLAVVIVATTLVDPNELATSSAPLAMVYGAAGAGNAIVISSIGVIAAVNGVIVQVIMGSRILYGLARQGWVDKRFADVNGQTKTPVFATVVVVAIMIAGTILLPLVSLAKLTSLLVLSIFVLVNLSLIKIKMHADKSHNHVTVPKFVPILGVLSSAGLILYQIIG